MTTKYKTKILIFGTGEYYRRKRDFLNRYNIVAFIDNNKDKQGHYVDGKIILPAEEIMSLKYDYICILTIHDEAIMGQLESFNISMDKVLRFYQIGALEKASNKYKKYVELQNADIVLITRSLLHYGAEIALYNLAKIINNSGYSCVVLYVFDGPLRKEYERESITVYEEFFLEESNEELLNILKNKKLVFCNTVSLREFVKTLNNNHIPTAWWIHESEGIFEVEFKPIQMKQYDKFRVYGVGPRAIKMVNSKIIGVRAENLLYMVDEENLNRKSFQNSKIKFAVIGILADYKGQDIFIDAIKEMSTEDRNKCSFEIIGERTNTLYGNSIESMAGTIDEISIVGNKTHDELMEYFNDIDVVVCVSRSDTCPMVVVEGMMYRRCCIVSPYAGIVDYIDDMKTGIKMYELTSQELQKKMTWVVNHVSEARDIGIRGYDVYDKFFRKEVFHENVLKLIKQYER